MISKRLESKEIWVTAFALFSLFFGAGNLILPPQLGLKSGELWWLVTLGFCTSAVLIPILGILAHAKLQGTIFDFGKKVSPTFSLIYSLLVYAIAIGLPAPRTASVTHEMAVAPFFDSSPWLTSMLYFALVFVFVMNRSKILDLIGKLLTPAIFLILIGIIGVITFSLDYDFAHSTMENTLTTGILEGYQTFDAIGAVVVGGVIIVSINIRHKKKIYAEKKTLIRKAGWLAGLALFLIYMGLILSGALSHSLFDLDISRTELLSGLATEALGHYGNLLLSILVALACFTTAVGIVTGTSDFIRSRFQDSQKAYTITAILGCILGVVMGQFNVDYIIAVALPALMIIYPITIVLILLNIVPEKYASPTVFKAVVWTTIVFSIPDFLGSIGSPLNPKGGILEWIPLQQYSLGWVLPALVVFVVGNSILYFKVQKRNKTE
ncbi:branched-chain amino acid transport system II carrier protein [Maribacter cobaltidurans]|uniref:Branched-chain amino acid transport system II carrier protein n=1 Tax=Maribacter cobaltidurans TaxID=1178778 RepID=A0A223V4H7_9FLAO|nr:branched-chain amino acid transport system II carrier protein [Maribacter cobaltidurans]ASV30107.1 branched-chain amino acid transport system II carrier protein [Maribacter cobaltidurans]GGD87132.1 branched-chain amino acid transport system carrier protein [Maribacter cobaltidurans]